MAAFPKVHSATGSLTLVQFNEGVNTGGNHIVPPAAGRTLRVVDCWIKSTGNAAGSTAVVLEDTAGTDVVSCLVSAIQTGVVARVGDTDVTASNIGTALGAGKGLRFTHTGSALSGTTSLEYCVLYTVEAS